MKSKQAFIFKLKWDAMHALIPVEHKTLLMALAVHAKPDGSNAHPSQETLQVICQCTSRTIRSRLKHLEIAGWVEVTERGCGGAGWSRSSRYQLHVGQNFRLIADAQSAAKDAKTRNKRTVVEFIDGHENVVPMVAKKRAIEPERSEPVVTKEPEVLPPVEPERSEPVVDEEGWSAAF